MKIISYWEPHTNTYIVTDKHFNRIKPGDKIKFTASFNYYGEDEEDFIEELFDCLVNISDEDLDLLEDYLNKHLPSYVRGEEIVIPRGAILTVKSIGKENIWLAATSQLVFPIPISDLSDELIDSWEVQHFS